MRFDTVIEKRISVRHFSKKEVTIDEVKAIVNAGRLCPSAKNNQPYLYVLVNDKQKNLIAKEMRKVDPVIEPSIQDSARCIEEANKLLLVFMEFDQVYLRSNFISLGASVENCCLKATDMKIDSLWVRDVIAIQKYVYKLLKVPKNYTLESSLCLGHRAGQPYRKKKKTLDEVLIINK